MSKGPTFCFAGFELDAAAYQLRRDGRVVPLTRQPMEALLLLVERRGELVSREDLGRRLWGEDVFLDRDAGLHSAILRIRQAIGETRPPAFIETVPGQGYRFVAQVRLVERVAGPEGTRLDVTAAREPTHQPAVRPDQFRGPRGRAPGAPAADGGAPAHVRDRCRRMREDRLVQQAGTRAAMSFSDGVWFVDLAPIRDPELLPAVVARTLDVPEKPGTAVTETLLEWLAPRDLLLILDNCEHLVDACATFVDYMLRGTSRIRVLTTSEALNVPG